MCDRGSRRAAQVHAAAETENKRAAQMHTEADKQGEDA